MWYKIKIYFQINKNKNTTYQTLWVAEVHLRGRFVAINADLKTQINKLIFHFKKVEKRIN